MLLLRDKIWSGKRGSNSRPQPWQGCALPAELFPRKEASILAIFGQVSRLKRMYFNYLRYKNMPTHQIAKDYFKDSLITGKAALI